MSFIPEIQLVVLLSSLKTVEFDFKIMSLDKIQKILITLLENNWNFYRDFGILFNKVYIEIIGHIKTSLFELFFNRSVLDTNFVDQGENNKNEIKYLTSKFIDSLNKLF